MTPEQQQAAQLLAASDGLNALVARGLAVHPYAPYALAAAVAGGLLLLRPSPQTPSVRPSGETRVSRVRPQQPDGREAGRRRGAAVRVSARREPAPKVWAVPGLVPHGPLPRRRWPRFWEVERRGYVTCVLGSGGVGKSLILLDLALAALSAGGWLGRAVRPVPAVLYVDTELDAEECVRRAHPLARGRGLLAPPPGLHYLFLQDSLSSDAGRHHVARMAKSTGAGLILVDSLTIGSYDVAASDQNGWNRVYTNLESWGVPVVAIDHLDKAGRGAFGSFMKQAKVRSLLQLSRAGDAIRVEHTKSNFGPRAEPFTIYPTFGDAVRFSTERPRTDALPQTDERAVVMPAPLPLLRVVPPPAPGRDDLCRKILALLRETPPARPWALPALRDAVVAAGICNRGTAYAHLKHLQEDGRLDLRDTMRAEGSG